MLKLFLYLLVKILTFWKSGVVSISVRLAWRESRSQSNWQEFPISLGLVKYFFLRLIFGFPGSKWHWRFQLWSCVWYVSWVKTSKNLKSRQSLSCQAKRLQSLLEGEATGYCGLVKRIPRLVDNTYFWGHWVRVRDSQGRINQEFRLISDHSYLHLINICSNGQFGGEGRGGGMRTIVGHFFWMLFKRLQSWWWLLQKWNAHFSE